MYEKLGLVPRQPPKALVVPRALVRCVDPPGARAASTTGTVAALCRAGACAVTSAGISQWCFTVTTAGDGPTESLAAGGMYSTSRGGEVPTFLDLVLRKIRLSASSLGEDNVSRCIRSPTH